MYVVLEPRDSNNFTEKDYNDQEWERKKKQLEAREIHQALSSTFESGKEEPGFIEKIIAALTNNLQVNLTRVHMRVEAKDIMTAGLILQSLTVISVDREGHVIEAEGTPASGQIFKHMQLKGLAVYVDTENLNYTDCSSYETLAKDMDLVFETNEVSLSTVKHYKYLVEPAVIDGHICLNQKRVVGDSVEKLPMASVAIDVSPIRITLAQKQYNAILKVVATITNYSSFGRFQSYRPANRPIRGRENVRQWWRFAFKCLKGRIDETLKSRSLRWTCQMIHMRNQYITVYQKRVADEDVHLSQEEEDILTSCERQLSVEQITYFRRLARETCITDTDSKSGGIVSKVTHWFGLGSANYKNVASGLSDIEKQQLYESIEYEPDHEDLLLWNNADNRDMLASVSFAMRTLEVVLVRQGAKDPLYSGTPIMCVAVHNLVSNAQLYSANTFFSLALSDFAVTSLIEGNGLKQYDRLISRSETFIDEASSAGNDLLVVKVQSPPFDADDVDMSVYVKGKGLNIIVNAVPLLEVAKFFMARDQSEGVDTFTAAAKEQLVSASAAATDNVIDDQGSTKQQEHKKILLDVEFEASTISVPLDVHDEHSSLVSVTLGSITVDSGDKHPDSYFNVAYLDVRNISVMLLTPPNNLMSNQSGEMVSYSLVEPVDIDIKYLWQPLLESSVEVPDSAVTVSVMHIMVVMSPLRAITLYKAAQKYMQVIHHYFPVGEEAASAAAKILKDRQDWLVQRVCKKCRQGFASDDALNSHTMAKHTWVSSTANNLLRHRVMFHGYVTLDSISLSIRSDIQDGQVNRGDNKLITLELSDIDVEIEQGASEMVVNASVSDLSVMDNLRKSHVLEAASWFDQYMLVSHHVADSNWDVVHSPDNHHHKKSKLLLVEIKSFTPVSPDYDKQSASNNIKVQLESLGICINPDTIAALLQWVELIGAEIALSSMDSDGQIVKADDRAAGSRPTHATGDRMITSDEWLSEMPSISVQASIKSIGVALNMIDRSGPFLHLSVEDINAHALMATKFQMMKGDVGNIIVHDHFAGDRYGDMVCCHDYIAGNDNAAMIRFDVKLYQQQIQGLPSSIALKLHKPQIVLLSSSVHQLMEYITTGPIYDAINDEKAQVTRNAISSVGEASKAAQSTATDSAVNTGADIFKVAGNADEVRAAASMVPYLSIDIDELRVIAAQSSNSTDHLLAGFHKLSVSNDVNNIASVRVSLQQLSVSTYLAPQLEQRKGVNELSIYKQYLLRELDLSLAVTVSDKIALEFHLPVIDIACTQSQLQFIFNTASNMTLSDGTGKNVKSLPADDLTTQQGDVSYGVGVSQAEELASAPSFTPIEVSCIFDGIAIELLSHDGYYGSDAQAHSSDQNNLSIAKFQMGKLSLEGHVKAEKRVAIILCLQSVVVTDCRGPSAVLPEHCNIVKLQLDNNEPAVRVSLDLSGDEIVSEVRIIGLTFLASNLLVSINDWLTNGMTKYVTDINETPTATQLRVSTDERIIKNIRKKRASVNVTNANVTGEKKLTRIPYTIKFTAIVGEFNFYIIASPLKRQSAAMVFSIGESYYFYHCQSTPYITLNNIPCRRICWL